MSEEKKEGVPEIKKVSDNIYINVSKIKTENVDLDSAPSAEEPQSPEERSEEDQNQGNETVGIP